MNYIHCLNNISAQGTDLLTSDYELTDNIEAAQGILVRSAGMLDMEFSENLLAIARAGAGVNNIPLERCAEEGIVVFNTPGANANAVKELVLCGMLLASRGIVGGIEWCKENAEDPAIGKTAEKAKKQFAGRRSKARRSVLSALVRSALKLRTQRSVSAWRSWVTIRSFPSMLPGRCCQQFSMLPTLPISIANAITSPSMCQRSMARSA